MKKFLLQVFLICVVSFIIVLGLDFVSAISTGTALTPADLVKIDIQKETLSPNNTNVLFSGNQIIWQIQFQALKKTGANYEFYWQSLEYSANLQTVIWRYMQYGSKALAGIKANIVLQVQNEIVFEKNRIGAIQEKIKQTPQVPPFTARDLNISFN